MKKFRKKPVEIEAALVTTIMIEAIAAEREGIIPEFIKQAKDNIKSFWTTNPHLIIKTHEGDMRANVGDYIIKEPFDKERMIYPCKPDIFEQTYELVE